MKVSALIAATLLTVSLSAQADNHGAGHAAPAAKAGKTTTTTTTTTAAAPAADHKDCSALKGKEKTACEALEKAAHAAGETHAH